VLNVLIAALSPNAVSSVFCSRRNHRAAAGLRETGRGGTSVQPAMRRPAGYDEPEMRIFGDFG
jgi:hypothetical protein